MRLGRTFCKVFFVLPLPHDNTGPIPITKIAGIKMGTIVELKYGKDAIAKQAIQNSKKGMVVIRAGKKIPKEKDDQRRKKAREAILNAILDERLNAYVSSEKGREMYIVSDEWELRENPKFEDHQVELTLCDGKLTWRAKPEFDGQPVYFRANEKDSFLDKLIGAYPKKSSGTFKKLNNFFNLPRNHFTKIEEGLVKTISHLRGV